MNEPVLPRPASTVLLARHRDAVGVEVLMVERPAGGFFGGLMVFPGGAVEDCDFRVDSRWSDTEFRIAGLRETAEEVGILVTDEGVSSAPQLRGEDLLGEVERLGLTLGLGSMTLVSRWVTPSFARKRFDTRFYLVPVLGDPEIVLDRDELVGYKWVTPHDALAMHRAGEWEMILPTVSHLRWLGRCLSVDDAIRSAAGADGSTVIEPISESNELLVRYRPPLSSETGRGFGAD